MSRPKESWRHEAIIRVAYELITEKGEAELRVAEVARRASTSTGAIYAEFINRAGLIAAVRRSEFIKLHSASSSNDVVWPRLKEALEILGEGVHLSKSERYLDLMLKGLTGDSSDTPWTWARSAVASEFDPELRRLMKNTGQSRDFKIIAKLEEAKARGLFKKDVDTAALQDLLQAITVGLAIGVMVQGNNHERVIKVLKLWQEMIHKIES